MTLLAAFRYAAVVRDHALRIARGSGGVVQRDGIPLVAWKRPGEFRIAGFDQDLVVQCAQSLALGRRLVLDLDHQGTTLAHERQRLFHDGCELAVGEQHLGFAMLQHEGNRFAVQPGVQRVQHRTGHGDGEVGLEHRRDVGQHHGDRVANPHTMAGQRRGQALASFIRLGPGLAEVAIHNGHSIGVDAGRPLQVAQRRQRNMVRRILFQAQCVGMAVHCPCLLVAALMHNKC